LKTALIRYTGATDLRSGASWQDRREFPTLVRHSGEENRQNDRKRPARAPIIKVKGYI
jgi:hypothetical protein